MLIEFLFSVELILITYGSNKTAAFIMQQILQSIYIFLTELVLFIAAFVRTLPCYSMTKNLCLCRQSSKF